jgi:predicted DNA-binding protein
MSTKPDYEVETSQDKTNASAEDLLGSDDDTNSSRTADDGRTTIYFDLDVRALLDQRSEQTERTMSNITNDAVKKYLSGSFIHIDLAPELSDRLELYLKENGRQKSWTVRTALEMFLEDHGY